MKTSELILSHGKNNEATSFPFWGICIETRAKTDVLLAGIWFNREDAEAHLRAKHYRFPKKAYVYCFSGHDSGHLKEMYANARVEQAEVTTP